MIDYGFLPRLFLISNVWLNNLGKMRSQKDEPGKRGTGRKRNQEEEAGGGGVTMRNSQQDLVAGGGVTRGRIQKDESRGTRSSGIEG